MSGIPNFDAEAGIYYGVISGHSIDPEMADEIFMNKTDLAYEQTKADLISELATVIENHRLEYREEDYSELSFLSDIQDVFKDRMLASRLKVVMERLENFKIDGNEDSKSAAEGIWDIAEDAFNDCWESDGSSWQYEADGYLLRDCLDTDIFVIRSPYFTYAPKCSPCVPGAGNLDSVHGRELYAGQKCYCLGADWFEDNKAPYPIFDVKTGKRI